MYEGTAKGIYWSKRTQRVTEVKYNHPQRTYSLCCAVFGSVQIFQKAWKGSARVMAKTRTVGLVL